MLEKEIIELFSRRYLNSKTNNYIFTGISNLDILDSIPVNCSVRAEEENIDLAQNIKVDLSEVDVGSVLSYTLSVLKQMGFVGSNLDCSLDFSNKYDLLIFQRILHNYKRIVQLVFYNIDSLSLEQQMLFNEFYYFNSPYFDVNSFIKDNDFQTYFLSGDRVLDRRDNYTKIRLLDLN